MTRNLYKDVDLKENLKFYLSAVKPYKWLFLFVIFLAIVMEFIGLAEKYLFKIILDNGAEYLAGNTDKSALLSILIGVAVAFVVIALVRVADHWFREISTSKMESEMIYGLKTKFFNHIVSLSHNFHTTHKTGSMISRLNRGISATERLTDFLIYNVSPLLLQVVLAGTSIFLLDKLSALVILITSIVFITYGVFISNAQKPLHIESYLAEDFEKGNLADFFTNIDSIKYFGKEKAINQRYSNLAGEVRKKQRRFWAFHRYFSSGQSIILSLGTFFVIYFSLVNFLNGGLTVGDLAFIYTVYGGLMGPLFGFVNGIRGFYISLGDLDELAEYGRTENEIKDKSNAKELEIKNGEVEFKNLAFSYGRNRNRAINGLSLKVKKNEKVALVGYSGCGKTTLIKLLYRLYDPDKGEILIDGKNIKDFKQESLRSELSIVPQEAILFDDTIFNNIKFSNPKATKEEVRQAMKFAQLDKFVKNLVKGENTIVGERGVKLSGGEKQRVSIARAILANKKILVLDEATSALDSKTEHEIQNDLEKLMKGRTSIIIAHRLSTIMKADKIVVMNEGKIVQMGKHLDLIKQKGIYKELWNLQKGGYLRE
jgi:ATP-binding cassette subfamily B protein